MLKRIDADYLDMRLLDKMPKLAGSADPLRYVRTMGGVTINNETNTGISIQGCDPHQNIISIKGAPIYYPNHLMGLYSVFNSGHFSKLKIEKTIHNASMPNRIGGLIEFTPKYKFKTDSAKFRPATDLSLGLIHSEGTIALPLSQRQSLVVSARGSYINLLYSKLLKFNDIKMRYNFEDANITYTLLPTKNDTLSVTAFFSHDKLKLTSNFLSITIPWFNIVGGIDWTKQLKKGVLKVSINASSYQNQLSVNDYKNYDTDKFVKTNLSITSINAKAQWSAVFNNRYSLVAGADYWHYINTPIAFRYKNFLYERDNQIPPKQNADEVSLFADFQHGITDVFSYRLSLKSNLYNIDNKTFLSLDPGFSLVAKITQAHSINLHYALRHQYIHQSALLSGGLPADYYLLADRQFKPEYGHCVELNYLGSLLQEKYSISFSAWFKQLYNLTEQRGNLVDILLQNADYKSTLLIGNGRNYGASVSLNKNKGIITGYLSYTLSWAKRSWPQMMTSINSQSQETANTGYIYRANQDRRHNFNLCLSVHIKEKWTISTLFQLASGSPYTAPEELYMLDRQIICRYGKHNVATMPLYHRLDLSASYSFIKKKDKEIGVSVSIYNLYQHRNPQFFVLKRDGNLTFYSYLSTIIPSVDFYVKI